MMRARSSLGELRKPMWPPSGKLWPQNRQLPDSYAEEMVAVGLDFVAPCGWGIWNLVLDEASLAQGSVRILAAEGRFPSGVPLSIVEGEGLSRALPPPGRASSIVVHLGIVRSSEDSPNVTDASSGDGAVVRYRRVAGAHGETLAPIVRLLFDEEGAERFERIPLATLSWAGQPRRDPWGLPPMLRLLPGTPLLDAMDAIVTALVARRAVLLAERQGRPLDLQTFSGGRAPHLLLLSIMNRALAVLEDPGSRERVTPEEAHQLFAGLLGSLQGLGASQAAPIPPYVHEAPGPGFSALLERLQALIPHVARSAHRKLPLQRMDGWTFSLTVSAADAASIGRRAYLVAAGVQEEWVATHLPSLAKIASRAALPAIANAAVRGVPVAVEFDPPTFLPSSAVHCAFRIDVRSPFWAEVVQSSSLVVHMPQAPAELELALYFLPRDER